MSLRNVVTLPLLVAVADSDQIQSENHQPEAEPGLTALTGMLICSASPYVTVK